MVERRVHEVVWSTTAPPSTTMPLRSALAAIAQARMLVVIAVAVPAAERFGVRPTTNRIEAPTHPANTAVTNLDHRVGTCTTLDRHPSGPVWPSRSRQPR